MKEFRAKVEVFCEPDDDLPFVDLVVDYEGFHFRFPIEVGNELDGLIKSLVEGREKALAEIKRHDR